MILSDIVNLAAHPITDRSFGESCETTLNRDGALVLRGFIQASALETIQAEAVVAADKAYYCAQNHSVYLTPNDPAFAVDHPGNRQVVSSKGCICDDDIAANSPLRQLYDSEEFRAFIKATTGESELHAYADPLSAINVHYHEKGQELGWHFDNSSFAITLLIQAATAGSRFEYVKDLRNADAGNMNYDGVQQLLDGETKPDVLDHAPGDLVLFRGRNSIHRVTPNEGDTTRMLAVLAYNNAPGVELSESARMTFYGRLG